MKIHLLKALESNYIFVIEDSKSALVIDPGDAGVVNQFLNERGLHLEQIWCTHHHWDHTDGVRELIEGHSRSRLSFGRGFSAVASNGSASPRSDGSKAGGSPQSEGSENVFKSDIKVYAAGSDLDRLSFQALGVQEGDQLQFKDLLFEVIEIPGHTRGQICFYSASQKMAFPGDTLFSLGCGRVFEGTNEQMFHSLSKLKALPRDVQIYCGHEYTMKNFEFLKTVAHLVPPEGSIGEVEAEIRMRFTEQEGKSVPTPLDFELRCNPFLRCELEMFSKLRELRNQF